MEDPTGSKEPDSDIPSVVEHDQVVIEQEIFPTTVENEAEESCSIQDLDASSALQLTLSGDSLQRFAKILAEKKLDTAEAAIEYFFNLHVKEQCTPVKSTNQSSHNDETTDSSNTVVIEVDTSQSESYNKRPGRPKGWRKHLHQKQKQDEEEMETDELPKWAEPDEEETNEQSVQAQPGSKLVDGVRKSTRKKKNPFSKTDFIPLTSRTYGDQNSDDESRPINNVVIQETERPTPEKSAKRESKIVVIGGPSTSKQVETTSIITDEIIDIDTMDSISDDSGEDEHGDDISNIHVQVILPDEQENTTPNSNNMNMKIRRFERGKQAIKRPGRPRKRKKDAILFPSETKTKICQKCNKQFETLSGLGRHKMSAHGREGHPYFCEHCDYTAQFDCDMKRHQLVHNTEKTHKCDVCNFSTNWGKNLELHKQNVHGDREPFKCDRCEEVIHNQSKVRQHMLSHNPNSKKCQHCGLLFEKSSSLESHMKHHDNNKATKTLECNFCDFTTIYRSVLRSHQDANHLVDIHLPAREPRRKKEEKCHICNKLLIDQDQLEVHMQLHETDNRDSEKPFYCLDCDARSTDINQMVRHRMVHSEKRPFSCSQCDYKTRWKKDLKTHLLIHTGNKTVHCPECSYSCYTKQRLRTHMLRHDITRRHTCTLCNMSFKSKQALRMHTMYHTGDAQYSCDQCEFKTVTEMRLRKHKLRHTDERNHSCDLCGKRFKQAHHVTQHRDIVHLGKPSYREKKRIQLQQTAAEALGTFFRTDRGTDITALGPCQVINDDGTTTIVDFQSVGSSLTTGSQRLELENEQTQYVMVETPQGYQYVAVVVPESGETAGLNGSEVVTHEGDPLVHTQVLLEDNVVRSDTVEVTSVTTENQPEIYYTTTSENSTVQVVTTNNQ